MGKLSLLSLFSKYIRSMITSQHLLSVSQCEAPYLPLELLQLPTSNFPALFLYPRIQSDPFKA